MRLPLPPRTSQHEPLLDCRYFDAGQCLSCALIKTPQDVQLASKQARAEALLAPYTEAGAWTKPWAAGREAFRNKVKLVVTGTAAKPRLGIIGPDGQGQDLRECPLPTPGIRAGTPLLAQFVTECGFQPYNPATDRGVLKFIIVTESPHGDLMVRFVAKRRGVQGMLFKMLKRLRELVPAARVVSLNVQPEHKAILEGEEEIFISRQQSLPMTLRVAGHTLPLHLRPQSFFQTNTEAAEELYTRAVEWVGEVVASKEVAGKGVEPGSADVGEAELDGGTIWDLYCGVGGFALALAKAGMKVVGVEAQERAIEAARESVAALNAAGTTVDAEFIAADATSWAAGQKRVPDVVVVNPPRRGIGPRLAQWIAASGVETVLYSSCNVSTMARDVANMGMRVVKAQVVDMFPHTAHFETVALLSKLDPDKHIDGEIKLDELDLKSADSETVPYL